MAERIAILGGGCGAMSAAFYLSATPELRERYQLTVYQQGWRLGGKGASGRNPGHGQRIEEHGLHMFLGFYENVFRLVRECFDEWEVGPDNPFQHWSDAFSPLSQITLPEWADFEGAKRWEPWTLTFPTRLGTPGDGTPLPDPSDWCEPLYDWVSHLLRGAADELSPKGMRRGLRQRAISSSIARLAMNGGTVLSAANRAALALKLLEEGAELLDYIDGDEDRLHGTVARIRRLTRLIRLALVIARGYTADVKPFGSNAFNRINDIEFRAWLKRHGAERDLLEWAPVRAIYTLGFAFEDGKSWKNSKPRVAAGVALKIILRMGFSYKQAPLWRLMGGMGDVVFSPLYEVLRQRGVEFKFFHRVDRLRLDTAGRLIEGIDVVRQATLRDGEYQPLIDVNGMRCWPSEPLWDQLADGVMLQEGGVDYENPWQRNADEVLTLERGTDFDQVVLGIPVGALHDICAELVERKWRWRRMVHTIPTVRTQSVQLWMDCSLEELGWKAGPTVMTGYRGPFDSWADLSELLPAEDWGEPRPQSLHYLVAALDAPGDDEVEDAGLQDRERARVRRHAITWLSEGVEPIWPAVSNDGGVDWQVLHDEQCRQGIGRLDAQYIRANVAPSELYVQSFDGTIRARMRPGRSGIDNLTLAGDWTRTGLNAGSAEAAIQSGALAARHISGHPAVIPDDPER